MSTKASNLTKMQIFDKIDRFNAVVFDETESFVRVIGIRYAFIDGNQRVGSYKLAGFNKNKGRIE